MEEGYLALRWNNHNSIFTKILNLLREQEAYTDVSLACSGRIYPAHKFVLSTCSDFFKEMFSKNTCKHPIVYMKDVSEKDLESLLDFMYKGEVHVSQSDLGSLLRTAEGLQIKGLAVPDDSSRSALSPLDNDLQPSQPNISNSRTSLSQDLPNALPKFQMKRKRASESNKKEGASTATLRTESSVGLRVKAKSSKLRKDPNTPEFKRMKLDKTIPNNSSNWGDSNASTTNIDTSDIASESPGSTHANDEDVNPSSYKDESRLEDVDGHFNEEEIVSFNRGSIKDEEKEQDEEGEEEVKIHGENSNLPSELDDHYEQSNSSLPNSELSTAELLQVDLSEDGTQFIIGPGGLGRSSRASSVTGEEEISEGVKKPFICFLCGHTFTRRDNLANHLKTHTGDRPFMCQYCHKCFSRKDYLKQHERIHTGEKPYACEICGRAFTRKEGLTDHMRCHSDYKAFACETCGKSFKQKCGLRFHKRNYRH